tara:strand:- start:652 stop:900 length:249 start_codon:yes stop_codon:yes gene_type:complete
MTAAFIVYSRDGCAHCTKVQSLLQLAELKHVIYKLDSDFTREEFTEEFGEDATFPQVVVDARDRLHLGGASNTMKYIEKYHA